MKIKSIGILLLLTGITLALSYVMKNGNINPGRTVGEKLDSLHGVMVYYNGGVEHVEGRNTGPGGYNVGLKYQCVEFVKRYYLEHFDHRMPDAFGHAIDFFDPALGDGAFNKSRGLYQFANGGIQRPQVSDLIVFDLSFFNPYGHVAIVSRVDVDEIEIIQQNPGPFGKSREVYRLENVEEKWYVKNDRILGWLRQHGN